MAHLETSELDITILEDGTVKIETGSVGGPEHMAAEKMLVWITEQLGGEAVREKLVQSHHHHHEHNHSHVHGGRGRKS
jgi:hypothetical protein